MNKAARAPSLFVPHGAGPMPLMGDRNHKALIEFLTTKGRQILLQRETPLKAILLVTAHWEQPNPTISSGKKHNLLFDYYGFSEEAYHYTYPAPGEPIVAQRAYNLLKNAGFSPKLDDKRGWDHGVFVPLKLLVPDADIPIVQMSVLSSQNAEEHLRMGKALEPLRDEGVAIVGSGLTFHNLAAFHSVRKGGDSTNSGSANSFEAALEDACTINEEERTKKLIKWEDMPGSRESQPKGYSEHFMPLLVNAGAGGSDKGKRVLYWNMMGFDNSAFLWQ